MFWFIPILAISIFSLEGTEALTLPIIGFLMILGEELGWRGFLQDALRPLLPFKGYILIGVMWELWHFTNRMSSGLAISTFVRVSIFIVALIIISYIMGRLTDKTKSLVIAVTIHAWINILAEYNSTATFVIFGCSIPFWAYLIWTWHKPIVLSEKKQGGVAALISKVAPDMLVDFPVEFVNLKLNSFRFSDDLL